MEPGGGGWVRVGPGAALLLVFERVHVEGRVQEAPQLHQVGVLVSCGRSCSRVSAGVPETKRGRSQRMRGAVGPYLEGGGAARYPTFLALLMVVRMRGFT